MAHNKQRLSEIIKRQAEVFLLDAGEFFPFGSYIDIKGDIKPCSAYIETENDRPESVVLIKILEDFFIEGTKNGKILLGAIGIDVTLHKGGIKYDGIQIRFFEKDNQSINTLNYTVYEHSVAFYEFD